MTAPPVLVDLDRAAALAGVTPRSVTEWEAVGIRVRRTPDGPRIEATELAAWVERLAAMTRWTVAA